MLMFVKGQSVLFLLMSRIWGPWVLWMALSGVVFSGGKERGAVNGRVTSQQAVLSNEYVSLQISLEGGKARTTSIRNLRSGKTFDVAGEDFILDFEGGETVKSGDLRLEKTSLEDSDASGKRCIVVLRGKGLRLRMISEMHPREWWTTRWLEVEGAKGKLAAVTLAAWPSKEATGPQSPGAIGVPGSGFPGGCGQVVYTQDLFLGIAHPGAANLVTSGSISCRIPAYDDLLSGKPVRTRALVIGAGEAGDARRAFHGYIDKTRAVPSRMICLVNDWYWANKDKPVEALSALARMKAETGVPIDSFTLDDGWDLDWDKTSGIWGRLNRQRFPGGWGSLVEAGHPANINVSLWFGPIGGYGGRENRIDFGKKMNYEINGDKLCLAGPRYQAHVVESFSRWAAQGMDYIKVDGFWPDCQQPDHGHPVGPAGAIFQMDSLMKVFSAWRQARPGLVIAYTSGSSPSPFWLQHADFLWRLGADDSHAGVGEPFDRNNTYLDTCLQLHRTTEMPISAFVTFDIVQNRVAGNQDAAFERGLWWLSARTSLHHDWYVQAGDLTTERWKTLARAIGWAKGHEKEFAFSRMIGGSPARGEIYGFSAFREGRGTLALRNPSAETKAMEATPADLLELPASARRLSFNLKGVYGETRALEGNRPGGAPVQVKLPGLAIAVWDVRLARSETAFR